MNTQAQKLLQEGQQLHQKGKITEALEKYRRAVKIEPTSAIARIFLALAIMETGQINAAVEEAESAYGAMKKPELIVLVNYGVILKNAGRIHEAALAYEKALEINPKLTAAKANLATIYMLQGRLKQAKERFKELALSVEEAAPWLNLARIAITEKEYDDALTYIVNAEDYDLTHPDCSMLRGRLAMLDADSNSAYKYAIESLKRAPTSRDAWLLLQSIEPDAYNLQELSSVLEKISTVKIESATILSIAVDICRKNWIWTPLTKLEAMLSHSLLRNLDKIPTSADLFTLLGANISQDAHLAAASKTWELISKAVSVNQHALQNTDVNKEKLRVGILSSDLRGHAIGYLVAGLFEHLPNTQIEWWAYNNAIADDSTMRGRLKSNFDRYIGVSKLNDIELANKIRVDGIDVLIDLNQMTSGTRAPVFAYRAAPLQIQWLGMPGTLGAGNDVDYIIVDQWVVDEENANGFSECLLLLDRSYQPNDHVPPNLSLSASKVQAGLPEDKVVFGVFNQYYKFSPDTTELWGAILKEVPNSVLWLMAPKNEQQRLHVLHEFSRYGIKEERIIFAEPKPQDEHIARLQWMDLVLDTWPYNAHTTCSDALRAGVPVLTYPQKTFASRVAAGILNTAGLSDWVANSAQEYVSKAIEYGKLTRLEIDQTKSNVHDQYWHSPMVDNKNLGIIFETMLLELHARHKEGEKPTSFRVDNKGNLKKTTLGRQSNQVAAPQTSLESKTSENLDEKQILETKKAGDLDDSLPLWEKRINKSGNKARLNNLKVLQEDVIKMTSLPLMLDIGASAIEGAVGHESLAAIGLIKVVGFEPDEIEYAKLRNSETSCFLPYALGDGDVHRLHLCYAPGMNSLLEPNQNYLALFPGFSNWAAIKSTVELKTHRLDDIPEAKDARFAKLDVQGAEKMILENGISVLNQLSMLQIESSPVALYHGEPSFFDLGSWLEKEGFTLHTLSNTHKRALKPFGVDSDPLVAKNHIFKVDAVFIPNPMNWTNLCNERLESLAFFAHAMYRSYDISMKSLDILDKRDGGERVSNYRIYLDVAGLAA